MVSALKNRKYGDFIRTFLHKIENIFNREFTVIKKNPTKILDNSVLDIACLTDATQYITEHMTPEEKILLGLYLARYTPQEISKLLHMPNDAVENKIQEIQHLLANPRKE